MWIRLLEYTAGRYMHEHVYVCICMYVNMPIPSEPLWSNPTSLKQRAGDMIAFDRARFKAPEDRAVEGRMSRHRPSSSWRTINAASKQIFRRFSAYSIFRVTFFNAKTHAKCKKIKIKNDIQILICIAAHTHHIAYTRCYADIIIVL